MMSLRSDPALKSESEEILKECVNMTDALLMFPSLSDAAIRKAALYGGVRTPARGLYYIPDLRVMEQRRWTGEK